VGREQSLWLEMALVSIVAKWPESQGQKLRWHSDAITPALGDLADEFPELDRQLAESMRFVGVLVRERIFSELQQMASAQLSPTEYVMEMRSLLTRDPRMGQFCTPWSVAMLMARLLGNVAAVFDPAADASVLPAVLAARAPHSVKLDAVFFNRFAVFFNTLQARILGADLNAALNESSAPGASNKKYTHCISAPPIGGRVKEEGRLRAIEPYEIAINQILKRLAPEGKAVVLVPESMLFSINRAHLREQILDLGLLEAVISLPAGSFTPYSGIKTSIIVLNGSRSANTPVRFVDTGLHVISKTRSEMTLDVNSVLQALVSTYSLQGVLDVKVSDIRSDEHVSWSMSRFASLLQQAHIVAEADGIEVAKLGTVLSDDILSMGDLAGLPLFQVSELSTDVLDMRRTARGGQRDACSVKKGLKRLDMPALVLARVGGKLKPTLFDPVDGPIAVGTNVFAFKMDVAKVDPEYLAFELNSAHVQRQVEQLSMGVTIASISKQALLGIMVRLPSLFEQRRVFKEWVEGILLAQRQAIDLKAKERGLSLSEWQLLGSVEHSLRPVATQVETPLKQLRKLLPVMSEQIQGKVQQALDEADTAMSRMKAMFKTIHQVVRSDKASMKLAPYDLRRLFRSEVRALGLIVEHLDVYFHCDPQIDSPDGVIALVDRDQFALVIQNLFTNMAKHTGATDKESLCVRIDVSHRADGASRWLVLQVENNGEPFPDEFTHEDLITPGKLGDPAKGSGLGGFLMDRIIANHGGRFSSMNIPFDDGCIRHNDPDERISTAPRTFWDTIAWMSVNFTIELPFDATEEA